jgi:hypothetical protein
MASDKDSSKCLSGKSIDELVLSTIIGKLKRILGEESANIISQYAAKSYSPKGEEGLERVKGLVEALKKIFGFASPLIEGQVLKNLYSLLGLKYEEKEGYDFLDYVKELRSGGSIGKGKQK